jgi:hypothetical protein
MQAQAGALESVGHKLQAPYWIFIYRTRFLSCPTTIPVKVPANQARVYYPTTTGDTGAYYYASTVFMPGWKWRHQAACWASHVS